MQTSINSSKPHLCIRLSLWELLGNKVFNLSTCVQIGKFQRKGRNCGYGDLNSLGHIVMRFRSS